MKELKKILRDFDALLIDEGCDNLAYSVYLDEKQGVGFMPENISTKEAISSILSRGKSYLGFLEYNSILERLGNFAKDLGDEAYETIGLTREQVYALRVE